MDVKSKFKLKLLTVFIGLILVIGVAMYAMVSYLVRNLIVTNFDKELDSYIKVSDTYLNQFYPGYWKVDGDKMYKGNRVLNDDSLFVDKMKENTGTISTIFLADTIVSTNVVKDNVRVVNTKADPTVAQTVLKGGKEYSGLTTISGIEYMSRYVPIRDGAKNIIGMLFVGVQYSDVKAELNNINVLIGALMLFVVAIAIVAINIFTNNVVKNEIIIFRNNL